MTSPIIKNKVLSICFIYIVPKPTAEFFHVLLLNNIINYMKREINHDLRYVYTMWTNMLVFSYNIVLECHERIRNDILLTREMG